MSRRALKGAVCVLALALVGGFAGSIMGQELEQQQGFFGTEGAVFKGDVQRVRTLLQQGADPNEADEFGNTALMLVALMHQEEIAGLLLEAGADPNRQNQSGTTALYNAVINSQIGIIRLLLEHGADPNLYEPLIAAVEAAEGVQIVKLLLENGADANVRDDQDRTAIEVVESQLQYVRNAKDVTSDLREGAESRLIEILDLLRNAGAGRPRPPAQNLLEAAKGGRLDEVKAFLAKGGPVDSRDSNGLTPLIWAAFKGYGDAVTLLLTNGADVNAQSHNGETALMLAAGGGHREVTRGLIEHGGDVNTREKGGGTALMSAVVGRDIAVVKMLLQNGADVNVQTYDDGFTALYFAVMTGQDEIAELLEEAAGKK